VRQETEDRRFDAHERTPLGSYVQSLSGCSPLARTEEHDIAVRFFDTRAPALADRLVTANLRLVVKICHEHSRSPTILLDLIQEGNIGLVLAVQKFDPHRGVKLSSYAAWWIRAYVLKFIVANSRLVKIGTTQAQRKLFFNMAREKGKLERSGVAADAKAVAASLDVPESAVIEMDLRLAHPDKSLDAPANARDEHGATMVDNIADASVHRPDVQTEHKEFFEFLNPRLTAFRASMKDAREIDVLNERLTAQAPTTLQDLAVRHGVSRERVRQIEERLKAKLRIFLQKEMGPLMSPADVVDAPGWT
jgi:RNA polymerase sigma-32 factor